MIHYGTGNVKREREKSLKTFSGSGVIDFSAVGEYAKGEVYGVTPKKELCDMFAPDDRYAYAVSPLIEVICQLRFPTILSIGTQEPASFQEAIRGDYPQYKARQDQPAPKITGLNTGNPVVEPQKPIVNYNFISEDNRWKVNLTPSFVALSTVGYTRWEEFAGRLDKVLAAFIPLYHPAFFERLGLRYINAFSRRRLNLEDSGWDELIQPAYLGLMAEGDVSEGDFTKCALDVEMKLEDACRLKLHAGLGLLGNGKQDPEVKFILDNDFSSGDKIPMEEVPRRLLTMHSYANQVFRGAITSQLHMAMGPTPI